MNNTYSAQLGIWVVGVRDKNRNGSIWSELWEPTSLKWFRTRKECWEYIRTEIPKAQQEHLEYKPLRYVPKGEMK